ncbi:ATP-dependent nuclease [Pseudomonas qingdaonensis]|uniref:ATP-dependent nuclease n=1 Tax=Pseudomonas qingdaonensis TaxID=2056231 RepID=UPI0028EF699F|nr:AAA family ATPase [Pseudomonas qingdaonensis]MEC6742973.1 AAA family ATPase [Pseudomonas qingdaonensis]
MRISRVRLINFANFSDVDVETGESIVIVGENKVGKSNFIRGLQLILDPGLSERDRQLGVEHFWDGLGEGKLGETIEVSVELTDFTNDPRLMAHLNDCVINPGPPMVARLTYRFQPKADLNRDPESLKDYEYVIFGGDDPDMHVGGALRRMLPIDVQGALRDAEKDLSSWRNSPLRPLIEELSESLEDEAREEIQAQVDEAQRELAGHRDVVATAERISERLIAIAGEQHAVPVMLGLAPTRVDALLRSLRLLLDNGIRGIGDASLGTANLIFLALKSLELDRLVYDGERDHTFFVVEEPEAHLHPHVQRLVYRYFLGTGGANAEENTPLTTILTTHSPHIASVTPIRSIVLLRHDSEEGKTIAVSTANAPFTQRDEEDLQRYIDVTRGEIFFSRGVILVEGDAERFLVPAFADALDIPLDRLGITVCSIGGTNFTPYVKLLGPQGLDIPHVILTDRDPVEGGAPLVRRRLINILDVLENVDHEDLDADEVIERAEEYGYFVNETTLEPELFTGGLAEAMQTVIEQELSLAPATLDRIQTWVDDPAQLEKARLLKLIERIGKGRFAQALAPSVSEDVCPDYIRTALEHIRDAVA